MAVGHFLTAKKNKDDEYYTLYEDVEKDMEWYREYFSGKTVYCPCDDYRTSAFVRYFKRNFHTLHLKALLASNYNIGTGAYKYKYDGTFEIVYPTPTGDFNSQEIEPMLTHCDIIVTNPPFSKLRDFIGRIMPYQKDILVMAPIMTLCYSTINPYLVDKTLRVYYRGDHRFEKPNGEPKTIPHIVYLTTLTPPQRDITYTERYSPEKYPKYDTCDAINIDRTLDIPVDYYGPIGVPLSFIKYYSDEWDIVGSVQSPVINGKRRWKRLLIRRRNSTLS